MPERWGRASSLLLDPSGRYEDNKIKAYDGVKVISGLHYPFEDREAWRKYYDKEFASSEPKADDDSPLDKARLQRPDPREGSQP